MHMDRNDENRNSMVTDLTSGSVVKQLLLFAFPLFASNMLQAIYNIVDMIVVGQVIGEAGMSAVSTGGEILHVLTFLAMGFSSAGQVIVAQQVGAGRMEEVKRTIGTMFTFLLSASVIMSIVCFGLRESILAWLNTPAESRDYTMDYAVTCIAGLFFIYGYNIVSAILRGMGDSKRPFVFVAIAAVLNIILDIVFVVFCGMEVFGAALATVIGQGVSFLVSLWYLYRHKESFGFDFKPESFLIKRSSLMRLVALGVPMAIQSAAVSISKIVLTAWVNSFGVTMSAVNGIYSKINTMLGVVSNSFTTAGSSMIGQNIGAGKFGRVPKIMRVNIISGMVIAAVLTGVMLLWPDAVFELFTNDRNVVGSASIVMWPAILNFFGAATRTAAFSLINGSGKSKLNLAVALIDGMIARVSIAALLGFALSLGCQGFWFGDAIAGFVPITISMVFYISGKWKEEKVEVS